MQHALTLIGIGKTYGQVAALHPTDLEVKAGEFLTLLGPSGSGKTTLLMTIAGFVEPSSGRMELDGRDITRMGPEHRNFGVVFQGYALFPHMSVWDNVWFPLRARDISRRDAQAAVEEMLEMMELAPYARRLPKELSGGQQQRVALARALVFKPELLLLDEPLSALDKALRKTLQTELKALHRKVGTGAATSSRARSSTFRGSRPACAAPSARSPASCGRIAAREAASSWRCAPN
jgi:putative spermidine/putrescine transport system ATP-binding protein